MSIDVGAVIDGFHGDCAATYPCGAISDEAQRLIDVTRQSFWEAYEKAAPGNRVSDISHAVQAYVEKHGYSVVRDFVGHGVGAKLHEAPEVPNFGPAGHGARLQPGMAIAVEPMVCAGDWHVKVLRDGWTTVTVDGSLSAHRGGARDHHCHRGRGLCLTTQAGSSGQPQDGIRAGCYAWWA